jgi:putative transposase
MPRCARLDILGVVQHVMARGIESRPVFRDDRDREEFLRRLGEVVVSGRAQLLAWALIPNHFHLVLRPGELYLKDLMRRLMTGYAGWHNRRHKRKGHLFQNRYRSIVVEEESYLLQLVRYVSLNPARAKIISGVEELDAFPWTGHAVVMGTREFHPQCVDAVLGRFGNTVTEARARYRAFIEAGIAEGVREEFRGGGLVRSSGGWEALKRRKLEERDLGDPRVLGSGEFVEDLLADNKAGCTVALRSLDEVLAEVSGEWQVEADQILGPSRQRRISKARREFYVRAYEQAGRSMAELARLTGRTQPSVWEAIRQGKTRVNRENL